ncbi:MULTISPECIES: hypothetical protein [unclassified Isoptericola]|uniref:hypothetical protein n=1 Tax=Isoptericola sp. NPDC057191 TaxID=3346041 RepID=UPI0036379D95
MKIVDTVRQWFHRERPEPLERPRDLPPRPARGRPHDGSYPHEGPYPQGADNVLGWRDGGGGAF